MQCIGVEHFHVCTPRSIHCHFYFYRGICARTCQVWPTRDNISPTFHPPILPPFLPQSPSLCLCLFRFLSFCLCGPHVQPARSAPYAAGVRRARESQPRRGRVRRAILQARLAHGRSAPSFLSSTLLMPIPTTCKKHCILS